MNKERQKFKIALIGSEGVGKSAICEFLCNNYFKSTYTSTTGCQFYSKTLMYPKGEEVTLSIWDIGSESLDSEMLETYLYESNYILYIYDITKKEAFQNIMNYQSIVASYTNNTKSGCVGNKTDLYHLNEVKMEQHSQICSINHFDSFFMSAKTGDQVYDCFYRIGALLASIQLPNSKPSELVIKPNQPQSTSTTQQSQQPQQQQQQQATANNAQSNNDEPEIIQGNLLKKTKACIIF